jgi:hypothetical protein
MPIKITKPVPWDVALLRDRLMAAFMAGDLDEHARLTQQLTATLVESKTAKLAAAGFFNSFPVNPASVKFEPGTLKPLPVE